MKSQGILATVGARGWIGGNNAPLPAGLEERTPVTIVSVDAPQVAVEDAEGRQWTVFPWEVDCGEMFCGPSGNWMHESKRKVLDALEVELARHLAMPLRTGAGGASDNYVTSRLTWILRRNGRG